MHEFSRFIQSQCDLRGWRPSELAARSGLSRQHVSKLLNDKRSHIGQMPDDKTIEGLAKAFEGVSVNTVRDAAARALGAVEETDRQTELDLQHVSIDALLTEIRRRVQANGEEDQEPRTQEGSTEYSRTGGSSGQPGAPIGADPSELSTTETVFVTVSLDKGRQDARDKEHALTEASQGSRDDYTLAARKGETEYHIRQRTEPQPEDENQDPGSDDPA